MLPNFIVIGAGKAGTTSLWGYLNSHPEVFMSEPKELSFFATEFNWHRGQSWYERHFDEAGDAKAVGEATGNYTNWPQYAGVPERMASIIPDARLVYVIRHPIERIISAFRYMRVKGEEHRALEDAVRDVPMYLNVSSYATQIDRYLEHYRREKLLVITSEELRDEREATMKRVFSFLDVDPGVAPSSIDREYNRTELKLHTPKAALRWASRMPGYRALASKAPTRVKDVVSRFGKTEVLGEAESRLTDDLRCFLEDSLREDTARLRLHLGPDFHCWGLA